MAVAAAAPREGSGGFEPDRSYHGRRLCIILDRTRVEAKCSERRFRQRRVSSAFFGSIDGYLSFSKELLSLSLADPMSVEECPASLQGKQSELKKLLAAAEAELLQKMN